MVTKNRNPPEEGTTTPSGKPRYLQVAATPKLLQFLRDRGSRSSPGGSRWGLSKTLVHELDLHQATISESDPRPAGFPQQFYELAIELLAEPWTLNSSVIKVLDAHLGALSYLDDVLAEARVSRTEFLAAIAGLRFAERLHLVEAAHVHHAPQAEPASPDL